MIWKYSNSNCKKKNRKQCIKKLVTMVIFCFKKEAQWQFIMCPLRDMFWHYFYNSVSGTILFYLCNGQFGSDLYGQSFIASDAFLLWCVRTLGAFKIYSHFEIKKHKNEERKLHEIEIAEDSVISKWRWTVQFEWYEKTIKKTKYRSLIGQK